MVLPFVVGAFWYRRSQSPAVVVSMIGGPLATVVWRFGLNAPWDISPGFFGAGVAVLIYLVTRPFFTRPSENRWLRPTMAEEESA